MIENSSGVIINVSGKKIEVNRPEPIVSDIDVVAYKRRMDPQIAVEALVDGDYVLIVDFYSSGLTILNELNRYLKNRYSDKSFRGQRDFRSEFRKLSHRLLLQVNNNKITVRKAPSIGWLKELYPELKEFLLPFPQIQGLNSSWQWYEKGINIPVLNRKIYPYFGTYFPTRFEHLDLFDNWLKQYTGDKKSAIDVGIGSGVLSYQMLKHGFAKIIGTDSNPNAIIGIDDDFNRKKQNKRIDLIHGDLFADCNLKSELIVFNPPWLPATHDLGGIDKAIYYDIDLFPRFFTEAEKHLETDGRIVLLFSNLAQITKEGERHPIEEELLSGGRFQKDKFVQKKVSSASKNTKRDQYWRATEMVELWVLKKNDDKS